MRSRYNLTKMSTQKAPDNTFYPDIMTFKISKFRFSETPLEIHITEKDILRMDVLTFKYYGTAEFDDIILWLNNIGDVHELVIGNILLIPAKQNMENFFLKNLE